MPGAIPSGQDPSGYTPVEGSIVGALMSGLETRTQDAVSTTKAAELQASPSYNSASDLVYAGLNGALGFPAAILKAALQTITGVPLQIVNTVGNAIGSVLGSFFGIPASQITDGPTSNLVTNPQFNVDLTGWAATGGQWSWSGTEGNNSVGAARFQANGVEQSLTSLQIPGAEGHKVTVKASRRVVNGSWTGSPIRVLLDVYNASDVLLNTVVVNTTTGASTGWVNITGSEYTLPAGTAYVKIRLNILSTMGLGDIYWDDISLVKSGQIAQNALNLGSLFGNLWAGLTGLFGGGSAGSAAPTDADLGGAQGAQRDVVASIAAAVARLQDQLADQDPLTTLIQDDFEYASTTGPDPALWDETSFGVNIAGHVEVDGHQVVWNSPGGGRSDTGKRYFFKGANATAADDYMSTRFVIGDSLTEDGSMEGIIARANPGNTKFLELRKWRSSLALMWVDTVAHTATQIGRTISISQPGAGSTVQFTCGNKALNQPREFTIEVNSSTWTITDPTAISSVGSGFRKRGFTIYAGTIVYFFVTTQTKPGRLAHWASTETPA